MQSLSSGDVDLLFVALHQASLQCSQKSFMRYQMSRGLYFYDQYTHVSHLGGIHRYKRHPEELNQALHHVRIALAAEDNQPLKTVTPATTINQTPSPIKQTTKQTNEGLLRTVQRELNTPIIPEILCKELDLIFERFEVKSKSTLSSSTTPKTPSTNPPKSGQPPTLIEQVEQENDILQIQEADDEDELIAATTNIPKVSLSGSLIISLHSTWTDLIQNTKYEDRTWQRKPGEDSWNRHLERKRIEGLNAEKQRTIGTTRQANHGRTNSRASITSITNFPRQQHPLTANPQMRTNRSLSRVSFLSANHINQSENTRLNKTINQGSLESLTESFKTGTHIEFKLSTQRDPTKQQQQSQINALNQQKGVIFDVPIPDVDVHEDVIALTQARCKKLLADIKQKILTTTAEQNSKMCTVWFYGENQHIRNRTNLLTLNESAKRQRSKFIFSLLRREIPEKYNIQIEIPLNKHKSYIQLTDGSLQIYYPSGRLAVLRLKPPNSCTIIFDDTDIAEHTFLGVVTSNGSVVVMQPGCHARFTTDIHHERAYLCNGRTGVTEKQIQWHYNSTNPGTQSVLSNYTVTNDEDDILPPLFENTVQLQLNSSMQLEYKNPTNIHFGFASEKEEYKFELGTNQSIQTPTFTESPIPSPKKVLGEKKVPPKPKLSSTIPQSTNFNDISNLSEKQQIEIERLLDGQVNMRDLPLIKELNFIKKRIRYICNNWLKECRRTLGIMDIDSYYLPEWTSKSNQLNISILKSHQSKSAKSPRKVSISTKHPSINNEFLQPTEREQILRTLSARKPQSNLIENTMTQFIPRSESAKAIKQKISTKNKPSSTILPAIKSQPPVPILTEENGSPRIPASLDLPFACPHLIRQRLIENGPTSSILYDTCTCRGDHLTLIHDLEFDRFIKLTSDLNSKQLIVIGIINSNLHQIENEENEESIQLYQILQTLHQNLNYGRTQISSCRLSTNDHYRCLIYDLAEATKQSSLHGPLLVRRHHVQPAFLLIYQHGQLIFGDYIFNGYGINLQDLKNQLDHMREQQLQQTALPEEFKFISHQRRTNTTIIKPI